MAKTFYTEHDIEDMAQRGERSLVVDEDTVLTDLAYESARKLGVELLQPHDTPPGAPIRPYINQSISTAPFQQTHTETLKVETIKQRVKNTVRTRLGNQIDDAVLERIIERVFNELGLR